MIFFAGEALAWLVRPPFRPELVLAQMSAIGVGSTFIVATTGFFTGMVLGLQVYYAMRQFGAEGYVGGSVALSLGGLPPDLLQVQVDDLGNRRTVLTRSPAQIFDEYGVDAPDGIRLLVGSRIDHAGSG